MPRPIAIAMVCSVAIHLALFAIVDRLLSKRVSASVISTPLLVSISHPRTTGDLVDDRRAVPAARNETADPGSDDPATRAPEESSETAEATERAVATEISALSTEAAPGVTGSGDQAVVTAAASKEERRRPARAAISPKQKKMLNAKVRKWTENLHRMPDLATGSTWTYRGQEYHARFTRLPAADDMGIQRVIVEISTEEDGKRLTSVVHMKRLAFSNFAQFVNRWDPEVEFHDDELDGRFHSNTAISLSYDRKVRPLFLGKVTTTPRSINVADSRGLLKQDQIFVGGLQTGVRSIRLPKRYLPFRDDGAIAGHRVRKFDEDTRITFRRDGSYAWQAIESESPQQVAALSEDTTYLVADRKVKLHVKGTVNGKVLVYSPERIVIEDDLVYEQHPEAVPDADDYLGLVSDKYVDIARRDVTGPGDLLINAAIYAKRRFAVRGYRARENALLYLYGSLSVGSLSATEPRFYTRIRFDRRLEETRPPGFPVTDRYEVESWDPAWAVEPTD